MTVSAPAVLWMLFTALWQSLLLAAVVGLITRFIGRRLPPRVWMLLWSLVLVRLLLPTLPTSPWALLPPTPVSSVAASPLPTLIIHQTLDFPPVSPVPVSPAPRSLAWSDILIVTWLVVAGGLLLGSIVSTLRFQRRIKRNSPQADARVQSLLESVASPRRGPRLVLSDVVSTPLLIGLVRPTIVLPPSSADWSTSTLRHVLTHELLHARHRDLWVDWFVRTIVCLHWFNPAAWLAARGFTLAREMRRDAQALAHVDDSAAYGHTLLSLATAHRLPSACVIAPMLGSHSTLRQRIEAIARPATRTGAVLGLLLAVGVGCAMFTAKRGVSSAQDKAVETRAYDVRDLLIHVPDYSGPNDPSPEAPPREQLVADLSDTVRDVMTRNGCIDGTIAESNGQLTVRGTRTALAAVEAAFETMRDERSIQIVVETHFIQTPDGPASDRFARLAGADTTQPARLNRDTLVALLREQKRSPDSTLLSAPRFTTFNGQRAYVVVTTQQSYVADVKAVPSTEPGQTVALDPTIDSVDSGITVDVRSLVSDDRKSVTIAMSAGVNRLLRIEQTNGDVLAIVPDTKRLEPTTKDDRLVEPGPTVQHPVVARANYRGTLHLPARDGGMLVELPVKVDRRTSAGTQPVDEKTPGHLWMLVMPTIIANRDVAFEPTPLVK
ncbi:MAG: M56 family metallopeptidase [Tepidisphaeraceae bacterium]